MTESPKSDDGLRTSILLAQYEACSVHHSVFYSLIWQIPTVAIAIGGGLTALVFGSALSPVLRIVLLFIGAMFMAAMTIALERFRSSRFAGGGISRNWRKIGPWHGMVRPLSDKSDAASFTLLGVYLYRFEGFLLLRVMMYLITGAFLFLPR